MTDARARLTAGLNPQQLAAVTFPHAGPVLVLAGAGCGKTLVLARRIGWLAAEGCLPQRMLALTFTRKAAGEMAERALGAVDPRADQPAPLITTFHGLGYRVLRERCLGEHNYRRLGFLHAPRIADEQQRLPLLATCSTRDERAALAVDLIGLDALLERLAVHAPSLRALSTGRRAVLEAIAGRMLQRRREAGLWDFADLLQGTLALFDGFGEVAREYAGRFDAVLVDEFQDTSPLQVALLRRLLRRETRLFVVGDDDQSIYGFRGADTGPILNFTRDFPGATLLKLETNYRSVPTVLALANRVFRHKPAAYRKQLRSGRYPSGRYPRARARHFASQEQVVAWIARSAARLAATEGIAVGRMAVLLRLNETRERTAALWAASAGSSSETPQFLTVHASKGLEFPVVFLCDLEESVFPHYRHAGHRRQRTLGRRLLQLFVATDEAPDDCDMDEERRLFYVGVTRAQRHLFLLSAGCKRLRGVSRRLRPSRFLRYL